MDDAEPAPAATPRPASVAKLGLFVVRQMARHKGLFALCILSALGVALATMMFASLLPIFVQMIQGRVVRSGNPISTLYVPFFEGRSTIGQFQMLAIFIVGTTVVRAAFSYADSRTSSYMALLVERDLRQRVFDEILATDLSYLQKERVANLFTILHTYPRQASAVADQLLGSFTKALTFAALIFVLVFISWPLTLIAGVLAVTAMLLVTKLRVMIREMGRRINVQRVKLNQVSLEALQSMKLMRLFGRERHTREGFLATVRSLQRDSYKRSSLQALAPQVQRVVGMTLFAAVLVIATLVLPGRDADWALTLASFILIVNQLQTPMSSVSRQQTRILSELPAIEEIIGFLEAPRPKMKDGAVELAKLERGIRFEGVSFSYDEAGERVLHDVSFDIPRGRMVALVGASGSGKSTTVQLVARLADPTAGRITVDGHDLRDLRVASWRSRLAVVSQDTFLFNATVRENIRFGRLDATDAEVEAAAKLAEAHEFILQLEQGYDTVAGDRGVRLSGGQAQRLAIARALLADPDLLILDEATSALDTATERAVQRAIERASAHRTVLAIAHRLSTVRHADEIIVLEAGRVVERGTHDRLMAQRGHYHRYVQMQDLAEPAGDADADATEPPPPPPVVRLVFGAEGLGAIAVDALGAQRIVRVVAQNGSAPEGDVAVLSAGSPDARVLLDGRPHERVPIFQRRDDGSEVRSRVVRVG